MGEPSTEEHEVDLTKNLVAPLFVPGAKVAVHPGDRTAYVMFVGQLPGMPSGYWVGVQYDEKVGKNDGTLNGKRYFTCPPGHGGFLRASKLKALEEHRKQEEERKARESEEARSRKKNANRQGAEKGKAGADDRGGSDDYDGADTPLEEGEQSLRGDNTGWNDSARSHRPGRPSETHPFYVITEGSGLTSAVVGSLAQFTIKAMDDKGNQVTHGGDTFTVVMRGRGSINQSQPALVRTKLTDRGDGTYMCEYRPWMTGQYHIHIALDDEPIKGSPFNLNVITLRPEADKCVVRGDALHKAVARLPQKFDVLFVDAIGHTAHAEELDVYVEPWGRDDGDGGRTPPLSPTSADGSAAQAASRIKKLDAPTRQRHLQLWSTRQAADRWMTRRAQEKAYGDSAYGENEKKKKTQSAAHNLPTFTHELSADKFGFAFGGVDPGILHAHGKLIKVHHVSYSVGLAGNYKLHVGLRQQMMPLPGSPFQLVVEPGAAYAASTRIAFEKTVLTGMADEDWQHGLEMQTADMLGNNCNKGGAHLTMALPKRYLVEHELSEAPVKCRVKDNNNGTYTLDWSATLAGNFPLDVMIDNAHVSGSPLTVSVLPAKPDVNRFVASGAGLAKAVAGVEAPIRIRVADCFDNAADTSGSMSKIVFGLALVAQAGTAGAQGKGAQKQTKDGADAAAKRGGGKKEGQVAGQGKDGGGGGAGGVTANKPQNTKHQHPQAVQDSQEFNGSWVNGNYEIRYVASQAGILDLNLWCEVEGGQRDPLPGSPFSVHVSEGNASPVGSYVREAEASKQGGSGITAGEHVVLKPQVHDQFGNPSSAPEGSLVAILDSPDLIGETLDPPKLRSGMGSYELTLEPLKAGRHAVHVLLAGAQITGSPVEFEVSPAAPNPQKCYMSRADPEPVLINTMCDILLTTHDKYGNQLDRGGVRVDAKAAGVAAGQCTVEDHKDGTYTIRLTAGAAGEVKVTARIDSVEIKTLSVFFTKNAETGAEADPKEGLATVTAPVDVTDEKVASADANNAVQLGDGKGAEVEPERAAPPAAAAPSQKKRKDSVVSTAPLPVQLEAGAPAAAPAGIEPTGGEGDEKQSEDAEGGKGKGKGVKTAEVSSKGGKAKAKGKAVAKKGSAKS